MMDISIEVDTSTVPIHNEDPNQNNANDEIRGWRGEPCLSRRLEPPTSVVEIQTSTRWLIVRVPPHVRQVDELAYTPKILSIGPLHRGAPNLKAMEAHKLRFLNRLRKQITSHNVLGDIEDAMRKSEHEARKCYSEEFDHINSNDFVQMLVLDAVFIVELLRLHEKALEGEDVREPIFGTRWMLPIIGRDLLMLENQIPMFALQKIHDLTNFTGSDDQSPLDKLALEFFETLRPFKDKLPSEMANISETSNTLHLLGLFQSSFVLSTNESSSSEEKRKLNDFGRLPGKGWVNNATRLKFAGIRFHPQSYDKLLTIEFEKAGRLKIPTLLLDDGTSPLLRNLLAYEQSNRYVAPYFTSLAVFLDSLVDTPKDIDILRNAGIIKQAKGGNDEIVDLLNSLTKELEFEMEDCYLSKQIEDINNFCRSFMSRLRIRMRTFRLPWDFLSVTLSYISLVQTVAVILFQSNQNDNAPAATAPAPAPE